MTVVQIILLVSALFLVLWVAYKIGKLILRIALGLAFLGLIAFIAWSFFCP